MRPDGARGKLAEEAARDLAQVVAAVGFDVSPAVESVHVTAVLDGADGKAPARTVEVTVERHPSAP